MLSVTPWQWQVRKNDYHGNSAQNRPVFVDCHANRQLWQGLRSTKWHVPLMLVGTIGGFIAVVIIFKSTWRQHWPRFYAALEGLALGAISSVLSCSILVWYHRQ